ncbi:transcriptional regulator-domain-containing protein [Mucidula mucida]|nr:transcriptional regulator-domain-containing protein [Mucidula mucida]
MLSSICFPRTSRLFSTSAVALAGHNKWSKIRDKKGANDASKSAAVSRARNAILIAVRTGGGSTDPEKNVALAVTLRRLKDIPKDNIDRALAFASKSKEKTGEPITYEVLAFGSVGVIVECVSNNPTRTIQTIREALNANSGHLTPVKFMFERKGCSRKRSGGFRRVYLG